MNGPGVSTGDRGSRPEASSGVHIAVLDYGIGNLRSAQKTLERVGAEPVLTTDPAVVAESDGVVLPGVGNFGRVMEAIREAGVDVLTEDAVRRGIPFMGICVGMQALYEWSEEVPEVAGLGILRGTIRLLSDDVKRPQMQWNRLSLTRPSPLFHGIEDGSWVYFVHSYAPEATEDVVATCDYGGRVTAAVQRDNVYATQFHPEKSGPVGVKIIGNFVDICAARAAKRSGSVDGNSLGERSSRSDHVDDVGTSTPFAPLTDKPSAQGPERSGSVDGNSLGERSSRSDHVDDVGTSTGSVDK